jgi:integrase
VAAVFTFLKSGLKETCRREIFDVKIPKKRGEGVLFLSETEQDRLEAAALGAGADTYVGIMLCLYIGIRIGEMCGLMWDDIDLAHGMLYVRRTMQRVPQEGPGPQKTKLLFLSPKTESSARSIPLSTMLVDLLTAHKAKSGSRFVVSRLGRPVEPRVFQYRFKKILTAAKLPDINYHATRHTFSTRAIEQDFDAKTLSELLGHASPITTMRLYAHSPEAHKRRKLEALSRRRR